MGFTTAAVIQEQRGDVINITTGCKELDSILEGAQACKSSRATCLSVLQRNMVQCMHGTCKTNASSCRWL